MSDKAKLIIVVACIAIAGVVLVFTLGGGEEIPEEAIDRAQETEQDTRPPEEGGPIPLDPDNFRR